MWKLSWLAFLIATIGINAQYEPTKKQNLPGFGGMFSPCSSGESRQQVVLSCQYYIQCRDGVAALRKCPCLDYPFTSFFNRYSGQCEKTMFPNCQTKNNYCPDVSDSSSTSLAGLWNTSIWTQRDQAGEYDCGRYKFDGVFGNSQDCQAFQVCCRGKSQLRRCAPLFAFDAISLQCVPAELATCWSDMLRTRQLDWLDD